MKELSIEQKARRYDEALARAKEVNNEHKAQSFDVMLKVFPELKESEDERIRKELIEQVVYIIPNNDEVDSEGNILPTYQKRIDKYIAWLEKQSKKVEPIEGFNSEFERQISQLIASIINKEHEYTEAFVKWTSDALLNYAKHEIDKQGENKSEEEVDNLHNYLYGEQNLAWSEEDIMMKGEIINVLQKTGNYEKEINWFKSLKDRYTWKPSDEQIQALVYVFNHYIPNATDKIAWNALQTIELMLGQLLKEK